MKEGNSKKLGVSGGIGTLSSRLTVEAPIVKDKGSFIVSGHRTYADLFFKLSSDEALKNNKFYFYDLNQKANYKPNDNNRLFVSGYFGRDVTKNYRLLLTGATLRVLYAGTIYSITGYFPTLR
jgi:hypothetical protein